MTKPKYRRLTYDDRRVIENMCKAKKTQSEIANAIGVSQSTISRELSRNRVEGVYTHGRAFMRTYLRLLLKPKRYLIGEKEADILETFLKKKWSPETISSVCFDKKISHQTIYNYIERERQLGGTLYKYLFFKKRRKKYGIKDYRGKSVTEYTNRLLKQYFPKKMDLLNATEREVKSAVSYALAFKKRIPKFIIVNHTPFHIH